MYKQLVTIQVSSFSFLQGLFNLFAELDARPI